MHKYIPIVCVFLLIIGCTKNRAIRIVQEAPSPVSEQTNSKFMQFLAGYDGNVHWSAEPSGQGGEAYRVKATIRRPQGSAGADNPWAIVVYVCNVSTEFVRYQNCDSREFNSSAIPMEMFAPIERLQLLHQNAELRELQ